MAFQRKSMWELNRPEPDQHKATTHFPIVIVLDSIRSMHNVGSIFRTADATNVAAVYLCGHTPRPPHRDIQKTALGATESVNWQYFEHIPEALSQLKHEGYQIIGVEQVHGSISLEQSVFTPDTKTAFIFGNEVEGISENALQLCDVCIEIPQFGAKHSFNITVAGGIILWEWVRQCAFTKKKD